MGQMQYTSGSCEAVRSEINKLEDNSQRTTEGTLKQSITQNVTNSGLGSGEFKAPGAHKGKKS